jgi:hypothetical protein
VDGNSFAIACTKRWRGKLELNCNMQSKGFVANISIGGYTMIFEDFLKQEFDEEYYNIKR